MAHAMQLLIIFCQVYLSFASRPYRAPSATRWKGKNEGKRVNIKGKRNDTTATADTKN